MKSSFIKWAEKLVWPGVISLLLLTLVIPGVISTQQVQFDLPQGKHVKKGNRLFVNFLETINANGDFLVLGTSETGMSLNNNNYWALLDRDSTFDKRVYRFGGAGRCAYVYFPHILNHPEAFKNLKIIWYINPTYWRNGLNNFRTDYYSRYVSTQLMSAVKSTAKEEGIYDDFIAPATEFEPLPTWGGLWIDNYRSLYYHDLNQLTTTLTADGFKKNDAINQEGLQATKKRVFADMDTLYNVTPGYLKKKIPFTPIDTASSFQTEMVRTMLNLVKKHHINCTVYLGPVNELYAQQKAPELIPQYHQTINHIKSLIDSSGVPMIDGTWQGNVPGTFIDVQHISEYGAYLTAQQIKAYYEKVD